MTYDKNFLLTLDKIKEKEIYAKVTALTFQEAPITTIEGRITAGSINVDGDSAVRRTCSLTLIAENFNYQNYIWGLNTKFKLEIGVKNKKIVLLVIFWYNIKNGKNKHFMINIFIMFFRERLNKNIFVKEFLN